MWRYHEYNDSNSWEIKLKRIHLLCLNFCKERRGTIAVSLAFILPTLIGFFSIAIDGSRFNAERSRLNDALNQSVYAVAISDNRNGTDDDRLENKQQVSRYLSYYFPDKKINTSTIEVSAHTVDGPDDGTPTIPAVDYQVNASVITHPIFDLSKSDSTGFNTNVKLRGNGFSGIVRRTIAEESIPGDYVFVVDFSGSMKDPSAEPNLTREKLLKKVVRDIGEEILGLGDGSTIGIVPFAGGVPVVLDKTNYASSESKEYGCSFIAKMKPEFENIDWNFWYNKPGRNIPENYSSKFVEMTDKGLSNYYYYIALLNGQGGKTEEAKDWLVKKDYCRRYKKPFSDEENLFCDADSNSDIHNSDNQYELEHHYSAFRNISAYEYQYQTFLNPWTVDIEGTLSGEYLFNESNVRNMIVFQNSSSYNGSGYGGDVPMHYSCNYASPQKFELANLATITKPIYYLLNLSDDEAIFDEFDSMIPNGGTDSLSGLLRSVPLIAQGKNPRKMIFVISDGLDFDATLRHKMMNSKHKLCNVITQGLKKYPENTPTTEADIYYISLVQNSTISDWSENCVGQDHAFIATNLDELMTAIRGVIFRNNISYINPNAR